MAVAGQVTVFELLAPGRAKNTLLLWIVSFCFLWASNGILFMLPTILTQRGFPLTQVIGFHAGAGAARPSSATRRAAS